MSMIQTLYGPVNNLSNFVHPFYGRTQFLTEPQIIEFAKKISDSIDKSGRKNIVVSETGARPLAYICEKLLDDNGINWKYIKFPREPTADLFSIIDYYLTPKEKKKKGSDLKIDCQEITKDSLQLPKRNLSDIFKEVGKSSQNSLQKKISKLMNGTKIADFFGVPFLYFDEYVDSGTTLQNANMYFNYLSSNVDFKTVSYFTYISNSFEFNRIHFTLFDLDSQKECFRSGAYPFENRLDLIGYYYFTNGSNYKRITLEDIRNGFLVKNYDGLSMLVNDIRRTIQDEHLLSKYQQNFSVPAVKQFINEDHLARQMLMVLEENTTGKTFAYEFLWQLADMYGPIWSPMPKQNHFDFFEGTNKSNVLIKNSNGFERLKQSYTQVRGEVLSEAANICLQRKNNWYKRINELLEEIK
jgi:hypothetical protein